MHFVANKSFRGKLFWLLDSLRGSEICNYIFELNKIDSLESQSAEIKDYKKSALKNLLDHATRTTAYYSHFTGNTDLESFPVVNKEIIKQSQELFLSNLYKKDQLYKMVTSGSTGTPFTCYQDRTKKKRVNAEIIYYSSKAGYYVGKKLINLKALPVERAAGKLQQVMQNVDMIDVSLLGDENIEQLLMRLERLSKNGAILLAYASTYDRLSEYLRQKKKSYYFNMSGLISSSEFLFDDTRAVIEEVFSCRCYSRYSNQENGLLGQDDHLNNIFLLNEAHYNIEIMKLDQDVLADAGEIGRIVVTDLYNYAMPMIRYDTGDIGSITYIISNGVNRKAINNFGGRKIDLIYDCWGNYLSPHKISVAFRSLDNIKQFQFVQEGEGQYQVRLIVEKSFNQEDNLKRLLIVLLGEKAQIKLEYVENIAILSSGKRNYIVNKLLNDKGDVNG